VTKPRSLRAKTPGAKGSGGPPRSEDALRPIAEPQRFDRLLALLPRLRAALTNAAELPDSVHALAFEIIQIAHDDGCILAFDWPAWKKKIGRYAPQLVPFADLEACCKLLTIFVRQDRFVENSMAYTVARGDLVPIVERIEYLVSDEPEPTSEEIREMALAIVDSLCAPATEPVRPPKPTACPACGAGDVLRCVPGGPGGPPLATDEIIAFGDVLQGDEPAWACRACDHTWGKFLEVTNGS
jgi:hypothetical protein